MGWLDVNVCQQDVGRSQRKYVREGCTEHSEMVIRGEGSNRIGDNMARVLNDIQTLQYQM